MALHAAHTEAHRVTGDFVRDFYERKIFDEYLRFDSPEEERAYREREEARQRAIAEARAEGTPEGELRALRLSREQMLDAKAHGADASPDFAPLFGEITGAERVLDTQMARQAPAANEKQMAALDDKAAPVEIPASVIASFAAQGISMPDQQQRGHGVTLDRSPSEGQALA